MPVFSRGGHAESTSARTLHETFIRWVHDWLRYELLLIRIRKKLSFLVVILEYDRVRWGRNLSKLVSLVAAARPRALRALSLVLVPRDADFVFLAPKNSHLLQHVKKVVSSISYHTFSM